MMLSIITCIFLKINQMKVDRYFLILTTRYTV